MKKALKSPPFFLKEIICESITQLARFYIGQVASLLQISRKILPIITNFSYFPSILEGKKLQKTGESLPPLVFATFQESMRM
ncbi:MAG: hypothetical protein GX491_03635 [Chloroflexi bacterium]|nr:hypothetical protein [Chloroflexota bacterium]